MTKTFCSWCDKSTFGNKILAVIFFLEIHMGKEKLTIEEVEMLFSISRGHFLAFWPEVFLIIMCYVPVCCSRGIFVNVPVFATFATFATFELYFLLHVQCFLCHKGAMSGWHSNKRHLYSQSTRDRWSRTF